jgi:hypothetical protein
VKLTVRLQVTRRSRKHGSTRILRSALRLHSKKKAVPVTGRGGLLDCEMLRILHCLDCRLTDGSPTHRPHFTPQKHYYFYVSDTHFC